MHRLLSHPLSSTACLVVGRRSGQSSSALKLSVSRKGSIRSASRVGLIPRGYTNIYIHTCCARQRTQGATFVDRNVVVGRNGESSSNARQLLSRKHATFGNETNGVWYQRVGRCVSPWQLPVVYLYTCAFSLLTLPRPFVLCQRWCFSAHRRSVQGTRVRWSSSKNKFGIFFPV